MIAVVDDEPRMAEVLAMVLRRAGHEVAVYTDPRAAIAALTAEPPELVLVDLRMPEVDGLAVLRALRAADPDLPVVLVTAHATVETAVEAMKDGALDYLRKPFDNTRVAQVAARALELRALRRETRYLRAAGRRASPARIVAVSPAMTTALERVRRAARSDSPVLVTGESGTGKEVVARAVHFHSPRVGEPFVAVNAAALSDSLLESELFGHERGAFTGANAAHAGLFERADGGTLLLDEVGETSPACQAKLLRVLQEGEVRRVGGERARRVDVRLVAATNRDLAAAVGEGTFREDLLYRLDVIRIHLPPLRERREDILPLARRFLAARRARAAVALDGFAPDVEAWMLAHDWPGNVRQLANVVDRGVALATGTTITLDDVLVDGAPADAPTPVAAEPASEALRDAVDAATARHVAEVLARCGGVKAEAARRLGIDRTTLYRLMRRYGL